MASHSPTSALTEKRCLPCEGGVGKLDQAAIQQHLEACPGWEYDQTHDEIFRDFQFKNYYETMAFVNAVAWLAHGENHHPDLEVHYNHCKVRYTTHAIQGLSENDFICAAKVNALMVSA